MLDKKSLLLTVLELNMMALDVSFKNMNETYQLFRDHPIESQESIQGYLKEMETKAEQMRKVCEIVKRQSQTLNELFKNS
ncbi:hypothetical protein [Enterococcus cecorum]|uniref:hypothetical protein n=1 Tax=Enterococcus cecorum TaxID=44008 RepID=UPI002ACAFA4D|nr:hypothetical protein [Enterococcus cecorum]MDZ5584693.1 hypothetical protein [Enterococcus cecorum]